MHIPLLGHDFESRPLEGKARTRHVPGMRDKINPMHAGRLEDRASVACVFGGRVRAFLAPLHRHPEIVLEHSSHVRCLGHRGSFGGATGYEHRSADEAMKVSRHSASA